MTLPFAAHCQRGHDRIEFTDRHDFELHMEHYHGRTVDDGTHRQTWTQLVLSYR